MLMAARVLPQRQRGSVFSLNSAFGFGGMAIGAVLAAGLALIWGVRRLAKRRSFVFRRNP